MKESNSPRGSQLIIETKKPDGNTSSRTVRPGRKARTPRVSGVPLSVDQTKEGIAILFTEHHLLTLDFSGDNPPSSWGTQVFYSLKPGDVLCVKRPRGGIEYVITAIDGESEAGSEDNPGTPLL